MPDGGSVSGQARTLLPGAPPRQRTRERTLPLPGQNENSFRAAGGSTLAWARYWYGFMGRPFTWTS
jgi:hypothetical protein